MNLHDDRPLVALTMGDVAGIGPKSSLGRGASRRLQASSASVRDRQQVGSSNVALACVGGQAMVQSIHRPEDARPTCAGHPRLEATDEDVADIAPRDCVDPRAGRAAYDYLITAVDLALAGRIDAITTLPLHKEALHAGGVRHPGHTEILAERCGVCRSWR